MRVGSMGVCEVSKVALGVSFYVYALCCIQFMICFVTSALVC